MWEESGELVDPHTAIGIAAAREAALPADLPVVAVATAHPAKFPDAVEAATGDPADAADAARRSAAETGAVPGAAGRRRPTAGGNYRDYGRKGS